jgi:DNA-binding response OmpR family regulator
MAQILVVEDSVETQFLLKRAIGTDHSVGFAVDLESAKALIKKQSWDLIVLDRGLPDGDGLELCKSLNSIQPDQRSRQIPILVLSASDAVGERVKGLAAGADDYLVKPFEPSELLARIDAILRRGPVRMNQATIILADLQMNIETHTALIRHSPHDIPLNLTPIEFKILLVLVKNFGKEVAREQLVLDVWGETHLSDRNVDSRVCHLRKKLEHSGLAIKNRREKGYYLEKIKTTSTDSVLTSVPLAAASNGVRTLYHGAENARN